MSIHLLLDKIKGHRQVLLQLGVLAVTASAAFYMGYVARAESVQASPVSINCPKDAYMDSKALSASSQSVGPSVKVGEETGAYVASRNGKKYYPLACSAASRIKDENKVFFKDQASAQAAGYGLAAGC